MLVTSRRFTGRGAACPSRANPGSLCGARDVATGGEECAEVVVVKA